MSKLFEGNIKLASTISPTGAQPLDDRVVVKSLDDLYDSFGTAIYEGMLVVVNDEDAAYILVDKANADKASGWKKLGDGKGSLTAASYSAAVALATADNVGQLIYVTADETVGEGDDAVTYSAGPYVVSGADTVAKLGTTTASGDLAGDVATLQGDVSTLKTDVDTLEDDVDALEATVGKAATTETEATGLVARVDALESDTIQTIKIGDDTISMTDNTVVLPEASSTSAGLMSKDMYAKLDGIESGAEVNVIEVVKVNGTALEVKDKAVDITIDDAPEYTIIESTAEDGFAKTYNLTKDGSVVGVSINIPKDLVIKSGEIVTVDAEHPIQKTAAVGEEGEDGYVAPTFYAAGKYMKITLNNDDVLYIAVGELVDAYTAGDTNISVSSDNKISVDIANLKTNLGLGSAAYTDSTAYDAAGAAADVLGKDTDTADSDTVKGAKKYADSLVASVVSVSASSVTGENAIAVASITGGVKVSLNIASGENAGNVTLSQTANGLKADFDWVSYD